MVSLPRLHDADLATGRGQSLANDETQLQGIRQMTELEMIKRYVDIRERLRGPKPIPVTHVRRIHPKPEQIYVPPKPAPAPAPAPKPVQETISAVKEPERFIAVLVELLRPLNSRTIHSVMRATARLAGMSVAELIEDDRHHERAHPRQIGMTICVLGLPRSLPQIGQIFGGRDHTTVINAAQRWRSRVEPALRGHHEEEVQ